MKKKKIVFIHPCIGESIGGSQVFVLELADKLKDKYDITILSAKKVNELCVPVFSFSRRKFANSNNFFISVLRNFLKKYVSNPDIIVENLTGFLPILTHLLFNKYDVYYPNNDWGGLLVSKIARKITKTPILFTEHQGFREEGKIAKRNLSFKPDKYVVLSGGMKKWVENNFSEIQVEHIPNGIDFNKFNPDVKPVNIDMQRPVIVAAARNQPHKKLDLVIEAVSKLKPASLLMLASGENINELIKKGNEALGPERFKLVNANYNDMPAYYKACDLFTLPSENEPFGLVYLEAMACNIPVVAPNDEVRAEIVGNAGIVCDVTDINTYISSLDTALDTDYQNQPFEQAQKFSWDAIANKYLLVLDEI